MANVTRLGAGGYSRPPFGLFANKPPFAGGSKVYTRTFTALGPGGYSHPPYGAFSKQPSVAADVRSPLFYQAADGSLLQGQIWKGRGIA